MRDHRHGGNLAAGTKSVNTSDTAMAESNQRIELIKENIHF